jgi:TonB-linked SusC/RagA family outer membrane protein
MKRMFQVLLVLIVSVFSTCWLNAAVPQNTKLEEILVDLQLKKVSPREFFEQLKEQSGVYFFYSNGDVESLGEISIASENKSVKEVLDQVFEGSDLVYQLDGEVVTVKKAFVESGLLQDVSVKVTGVVKDAKGVTLPSVTVVEKGTMTGTTTNLEGFFKITVSNPNAVLVFTYVGMKAREVSLRGRKSLSVLMEDDTQSLGEVRVVSDGFRKIDRKLATGSSAKVMIEEVKLAGETDVSKMLEGRVSGVSVQTVNAAFGAAPKVRVRGASSIYGDTKPLWVLDGVILEDLVEVSPDELGSGDAKTLISSSVAGVNADDIADIQVLKDASATALYGARAMNGVIVITTKMGKKGKARIGVNSQFTMRAKPNYSQFYMMNSQEEMSVFREMERKGWLNHSYAVNNSNGGVYTSMYKLINEYDPVEGFGLENTEVARRAYLQQAERRNTDWFDLLFRNSVTQDHSISMSGGSEASQYYGSVSLYKDGGWTIADNVTRATANMKLSTQVTDKFGFTISSNASIRSQEAPGSFQSTKDAITGRVEREFDINPYAYALSTSRTLSPKENGERSYYTRNYVPFNIYNEIDKNRTEIDMMDLSLKFNGDYKFNKHLNIKLLGSYRRVKSTTKHLVEEGSNAAEAYRADYNSIVEDGNPYLYRDKDDFGGRPYSVLPYGGFYFRTDDEMTSMYLRSVINYNKTFKEVHSINFIGGAEMRDVKRASVNLNGYGMQFSKGNTVFTDYRILKRNIEGGQNYFGERNTRERTLAAFANLAYAYKGKYIVNGTYRVDGSNRFGKTKDNRYLPTWNVSGKWNAGEEWFIKELDWMSHLSFRGTYGLTATMGAASNVDPLYVTGKTVRTDASYNTPNLGIYLLGNKELSWEKQYETNVGFDLGLFNNRIQIQFDKYWRRGFDLISVVPSGGLGGTNFKIANYANLKSGGFEFSLNTTNIKRKDFSWTTNITFAKHKGEITKLNNSPRAVSYKHLRSHETLMNIGCPLIV